MAEINHVLVPTDGSADACKAAAYAGDLARALGARVSVLVVQSEDLIVPQTWGAGGMSVEEVRGKLEHEARDKELPATVQALGKLEPAVEQHAIWGHPAEEICRFAAEHNVDLIIMGSHGRSGLGRMLLGSVSNAVANQASCPVTIVR